MRLLVVIFFMLSSSIAYSFNKTDINDISSRQVKISSSLNIDDYLPLSKDKGNQNKQQIDNYIKDFNDASNVIDRDSDKLQSTLSAKAENMKNINGIKNIIISADKATDEYYKEMPEFNDSNETIKAVAIDIKDKMSRYNINEENNEYSSQEFANTITAVSIFDEMRRKQADNLGGISQGGNPAIFRGKREFCKITGGKAIKDCCNFQGLFKENGFVFNGCKESEKLGTALLRDKRCHLVTHRYCSKKWKLGFIKKCVEWKNSYCCFGSQIAKIVHEIARDDPEQLALKEYNRKNKINFGWGRDGSPNCISLTAKQMSLVNFDTKFATAKLTTLAGGKKEKLLESINNNISIKKDSYAINMQRNIQLREKKFGVIRDRRYLLEENNDK